MSKKATIDVLRGKYVEALHQALTAMEEEVLQVGSNELAIPVVDDEGEEQYIVFKVQVPQGSRDGEAYDAYGLAQEYVMKREAKAKKAEENAKKKAAKIARDQKMREQKAAAKVAHEEK